MRKFVELFERLDETNRTTEKVAALRWYFSEAPPADAAWALFFLSGKRLRSPVSSGQLKRWAADISGQPEWMVDVCYARVGDLAETLALLVAGACNPEPTALPSLQLLVEETIQPMRDASPADQRSMLDRIWRSFPTQACLVFNKLITGAFRMGVQRKLVLRGLAESSEMDAAVLEHRLMGSWVPSAAQFCELVAKEERVNDPARPYPFLLAYPLEERSTSKTGLRLDPDLQSLLGPRENWQVEWKYDGMRAQLINRRGSVLLWSRGDAGITETFPEIAAAGTALPEGCVLDGEILVWRGAAPSPFSQLQRRLGRKASSSRLLKSHPCIFMAYDCLELDGEDIREAPLQVRRQRLESVIVAWQEKAGELLVAGHEPEQQELPGLAELLESAGEGGPVQALPTLRASPLVDEECWESMAEKRQEARARGVEGLMIKRRESPYGVGRVRGDWWKWKTDPYTIDAVLIYAQAGHGRRAGLDTDFTFAVWNTGDPPELVALCRAYSGLSDKEFRRVNRWIGGHTLERRGPVRMVEPALIFEIAFEGIQQSPRHKSGYALRFPRISRWREDKTPEEADTLDTMRALAGDRG